MELDDFVIWNTPAVVIIYFHFRVDAFSIHFYWTDVMVFFFPVSSWPLNLITVKHAKYELSISFSWSFDFHQKFPHLGGLPFCVEFNCWPLPSIGFLQHWMTLEWYLSQISCAFTWVSGVRRLVIVEAGSKRVEGIVSLGDIFKFLLGWLRIWLEYLSEMHGLGFPTTSVPRILPSFL